MIGSACSLSCVECSFLGREGAGKTVRSAGLLRQASVSFLCVFGEAVLCCVSLQRLFSINCTWKSVTRLVISCFGVLVVWFFRVSDSVSGGC